MPPLSRPRRRRWLMMNESPTGNVVAEPVQAEAALPLPVPTETEGTMRNRFLDDCGIPEGFNVHVTMAGQPEVHTAHIDDAFAFIGRDEECAVRLPGSEIGRHHACIQAVGGQFVVVDLGSRTGVRQHSKPVRTALLSSGDSVEIGPYTICVSRDAGGEFHELPTEAQTQRRNPPIALHFFNQSRPIAPWTIDIPYILIGSAKPSRIRLEHSSVTPQHCVIVRGFTNWWIVDLNSQSGTLVDDVRVNYAPLQIGAKLQVGRYPIAIQKPRLAESVIQPPVFDHGPLVNHGPVQTPSLVDAAPMTPSSAMSSMAQGAPSQVVNEHLVVELFKEFAALHERTVSQLQQSFREMLEVATSNRPAIAYTPAPIEPAAATAPAPLPLEPDRESDETSLSDLMRSEDPEERAAAQELLAAQMRSLEAQMKGEREGIAKRLMRSLSLRK